MEAKGLLTLFFWWFHLLINLFSKSFSSSKSLFVMVDKNNKEYLFSLMRVQILKICLCKPFLNVRCFKLRSLFASQRLLSSSYPTCGFYYYHCHHKRKHHRMTARFLIRDQRRLKEGVDAQNEKKQ